MQQSEVKKNSEKFFPADAALVSALVDGEIAHDALPDALAFVAADDELADTWQRYYLLREAIRGGLPDDYLPDFSEKVMNAIVALPPAEHPQAKTFAADKKPPQAPAWSDRFSPWWPALALASTLSVVLVLWSAITPTFMVVSKSSLTTSPAFLPTLLPESVAVRPITPQELDAEWQTLLREHAAYQEVLPSMLPYTRMPMLRTAAAP